MASMKDYYAMNLKDLRRLCISKKLRGITMKSNRTKCINAIQMQKVKRSPSISKQSNMTNRRHSLPKSSRIRRNSVSHSHSPIAVRSRSKTDSVRKSRKRSRKEMNDDANDLQQISDNESKRKRRRKTKHPSIMSLVSLSLMYIRQFDVIFFYFVSYTRARYQTNSKSANYSNKSNELSESRFFEFVRFD